MPVTFNGGSEGESGTAGSTAAIVSARWSCIFFAVACQPASVEPMVKVAISYSLQFAGTCHDLGELL